jgi:acyl-homoserine lactone acylase PvdQ
VKAKRFPYGLPPRKPRGVAIPDYGSVKQTPLIAKAGAPGENTRSMSNALLVSAAESATGRPLAVFGPQTAYFAPQVLMEHDVHAPDLDARGVAFPGSNLFVQLGHGRDYAWSATTSAQDIVDTFAVETCDGDKGYMFRGECKPIEMLQRTNSWQQNAADSTPSGSETLTAQRTALGVVRARATVKGKPVLLTSLRSTYGHETDSGLAFSLLNDPKAIRSPQDFQKAAALIPYTFNWFYADSEHIAYQNSGANPVRAPRTDNNLPIDGRLTWRDWEPFGTGNQPLTNSTTPPEWHPNAIDQPSFADWNGKQAFGYASADGNWGYGSVYRQQLLEGRVRRLIAGERKATLPELAEAMADAATVDLRGDAVLPYALKVLAGTKRADLKDAIAKLAAWQKDGSHRIDADGNGEYEHSEAIRILDAWWPRWMKAQFEPALGTELFDAVAKVHKLDNHPNNGGDHVGSAWQDGWYSWAQKDLRRALGRKVRGFWPRRFCGRGRLARCRQALETSLKEAIDNPPTYKDDLCPQGGQTCFDSIWHRPLGGVTQPLIPWQNRPTFQQVVEIPRNLPTP